MDEKLTDKEIEILKYINNHQQKKVLLKLNKREISEKFQVNELELNEMILRFKDKGLIKKSKKEWYFVIDIVAEITIEILGEIFN